MSQNLRNELKEKLMPLYQRFESLDFDVKNLSAFNIQVGSKWKKGEGILFVGKAVNGWRSFDELFNEDNEPLSWVEEYSEEYNPKNSAFWRIIKKVARENNSTFETDDWYKNIAWSNLCKLSPKDGGNPSNSDFYKQRDVCKEILLAEIEILQPKVAILFTSDWDILGVKDFERITEEFWDKHSSILYKNKGVNYIHTVHPQGKNERLHKDAIHSLLDKIK